MSGDDSKAKEVAAAAHAIADNLNARVIVYGGYIDYAGVGQLLQTIGDGKDRENTFFVLTTVGGDARAAYRIARLFQMASKKFYLCVPSMCKSAGTLIALGAHEIVMNPFAELGPLDVQLVQRDEIDQSRSGLVVDTALEGLAKKTLETFETIMLHITFGSDKSISFEAASKVAASLTTGTMSEIYAQIKPSDLGNDLRNLRVAEAYGNQLAAYGRNTKPNAVSRLVHKYPSHDYIIDAEEAKTLFKTVDTKQQATHTIKLMSALGEVSAAARPAYISRLDSQEKKSDQKSANAGTDETTGGGTGSDNAKPRPARKGSRRTNQTRDRNDGATPTAARSEPPSTNG